MILLDTSTNLEIVLSDTPSTELDWVAVYIDTSDDTPKHSDGTTNATTDVTMVSSPASNSRLIRNLSINNINTSAQTVTIKIDDGVNERILVKKELNENETLIYDSQSGWYIAFSNSNSTDVKIKVSANDTNDGYLEDKIIGTANKITVTTTNEGANEQLQINKGSDMFDKATDDANDIATDEIGVSVQDKLDNAVTELNDLSDVDIASGEPSDNDILKYNSSSGKWEPEAESGSGQTSEYDNGNSGASKTIVWDNGNHQKITMTDNCTFTFTAPTYIGFYTLKCIQDGTGNRSATWPGSVHGEGNSQPKLSSPANSIDVITFYYDGAYYIAISMHNILGAL